MWYVFGIQGKEKIKRLKNINMMSVRSEDYNYSNLVLMFMLIMYWISCPVVLWLKQSHNQSVSLLWMQWTSRWHWGLLDPAPVLHKSCHMTRLPLHCHPLPCFVGSEQSTAFLKEVFHHDFFCSKFFSFMFVTEERQQNVNSLLMTELDSTADSCFQHTLSDWLRVHLSMFNRGSRWNRRGECKKSWMTCRKCKQHPAQNNLYFFTSSKTVISGCKEIQSSYNAQLSIPSYTVKTGKDCSHCNWTSTTWLENNSLSQGGEQNPLLGSLDLKKSMDKHCATNALDQKENSTWAADPLISLMYLPYKRASCETTGCLKLLTYTGHWIVW